MADNVVPTLEEKLDNKFLSTWYKIQKEATDNILEASVVMTLMREKGMLEKQVGGRLLTENVRYDVSGSKWVKKGSTLPQGEKETETMGIWTWNYLAGHVQRSAIDDQQNSGPDKIKDYVKGRITDARDGLAQDLEKYLLYGSEDLSSFFETDTETLVPEEIEIEGHDGPVTQGLNTLVPPPDYANNRLVADGTFGRIKRCSAYTTNSVGCYVPDKANATNAFWGPRYGILRKPYAVYLVEDMNRLYDTIFNNQVAPDIILSTLELFEVYKDMALDVTQIVTDTKTRAADPRRGRRTWAMKFCCFGASPSPGVPTWTPTRRQAEPATTTF